MKIYLIEERKIIESLLKDLVRYGEIAVLDSGEKDIRSYKQLFKDQDKILGVNPGIIDWNLPVESLRKMKGLKGICTKSTWANFIDINYCKKNGIQVCNLAGYNSQSVAEYAIWMMMSLAKKLPLQISNNFKVILNDKMMQTEIKGKVMGVVGLGNVGKRIAQMGKGLGMEVVYWSRMSRDKRYKYKKLPNLLKTSDFIFNCVQTLEETEGFLDRSRLGLLKKSAFVISVIGGMGWGPQDDNYLIRMVNRGELAGYAIENEHEPNYKKPEVKKGSNVFIPGNYAFYTKEAQERGLSMWIDTIVSLAKEKPINVVN